MSLVLFYGLMLLLRKTFSRNDLRILRPILLIFPEHRVSHSDFQPEPLSGELEIRTAVASDFIHVEQDGE